MPTISVVHSTVAEVIAGVESEKSISPGTLKEALTSGNMYGMNFASVTGNSLFGDGSNLTGLIKDLSGNQLPSVYSDTLIDISRNRSTQIATICARKIISPEWHVGRTGLQLPSETVPNRTMQTVLKTTEFQEHIKLINQVNPVMTGGITISTPPGTTFGNGDHNGGVLMADGRVFCVPFSSTIARIYDPILNITTTPNGLYPGNACHESGALLADGRVFCMPRNFTCPRIYDPASNTLTTPTGSWINIGADHHNCSLLPDGRVFCAPLGVTFARIYDPVTNTTTTPNGFYPPGFSPTTTLLDGRIYMASGGGNVPGRIYNPYTDTISTPAGLFGGFGAHNTALMVDGRVFCMPYGGTNTARIYDPFNDTFTTPPGVFDGAKSGGCNLPDGRLLIAPNGGAIYVYDPINNTLTTHTSWTGGGYQGAVLMNDGRVYLVPFTATVARIISVYFTEKYSLNAVTTTQFKGF